MPVSRLGRELRDLIHQNVETLDLEEVRGSLCLLELEPLLDEILRELAEAPLAAGAGESAPAVPSDDPYADLDDLMAAVEALCPRWPARDRIIAGPRFLL